MRDAELKKKRHAEQAAGKEKRKAAVLDAKETRRLHEERRTERLRGYIGRRVRIWWNAEEYYDGVVESWLGERPGLGKNNGRHVIHYDDNTKVKEDLVSNFHDLHLGESRRRRHPSFRRRSEAFAATLITH